MTRLRLLLLAAAVMLLAADTKETKSALESDPTGWTDLLGGREPLKGWKRVAIPPGGKLKDGDPWKVVEGVLVCDGVGFHEMLLWDKEWADGIVHVEWRFKPVEGKKGYNSGIYVRNSADGTFWHQAQVGSKNVGYVFGDTKVNGEKKRVRADDKVAQRGKAEGEWNTFEITCKGKTVTLWVNGAVTTTWNDCEIPKGYFGVEAEGWLIEFRNVKFKELK